MKIYTRRGDKGKTDLIGGDRVLKDSLRVETYGTIDELNSIIGIARAFHNSSECNAEICKRIDSEFHKIQNDLFNVGANLATPSDKVDETTLSVTEDDVKNLENFIDEMSKDLEPLKRFILPSGGKVSSFLHNARTVCRRAERRILSLSREEDVDAIIIKYINRLSDTLFAMARWEAQNIGEPEYYWGSGK